MAWSYSGDPSTSPKDAVRFYMQDIDAEDPNMTDEDILFLLISNPDPQLAAIHGLEILITKFAQLADRTIGELKISYTQKLSQLTELVSMLRESTNVAVDISSGGSAAYVHSKILFRKGMFDNG
jgi:hypothetical protein